MQDKILDKINVEYELFFMQCMSCTKELLAEPVPPMIPMVSPERMEILASEMTFLSAFEE